VPEHIRALGFILFLATAVFWLARAPACAVACAPADFERRRNLWYGITLAVFLAHNYYVYVGLAALLVLVTVPREKNRLAMYFAVLFAAPLLPNELPGFGLMDHFFVIDYARLLSLALLLPAALALRKNPDHTRFGVLATDKLIAAYIALNFLMAASYSDNLTNVSRHGLFYVFIDIFLPYYVASRALRDLQSFRDALMAFAISAMIICAVSIVEYGKTWLLYKNLEEVLGLGKDQWGYNLYLMRGESLRAVATAGQPVVLGYLVVVALGFFLYLRKLVPSPVVWRIGLLLLVGGLLAPVSRGPWMGAIAGLVVFVALGPSPALGLSKLALVSGIVVAAVLFSPAGDKVIELVPFVGNVEPQNAEYRQRFLEVGLAVIKQSPLLGNYYFGRMQEFDELRPQGILDTLNVFLTVGLQTGLVGLTFFGGACIAAGVSIVRGMRRVADRTDERYLLGRALFSVLIAVIVIMNTISNILLIPTIYWLVCGMGAAYLRVASQADVAVKRSGASERSGFRRRTVNAGS
jgi:hypothetical protein